MTAATALGAVGMGIITAVKSKKVNKLTSQLADAQSTIA